MGRTISSPRTTNATADQACQRDRRRSGSPDLTRLAAIRAALSVLTALGPRGAALSATAVTTMGSTTTSASASPAERVALPTGEPWRAYWRSTWLRTRKTAQTAVATEIRPARTPTARAVGRAGQGASLRSAGRCTDVMSAAVSRVRHPRPRRRSAWLQLSMAGQFRWSPGRPPMSRQKTLPTAELLHLDDAAEQPVITGVEGSGKPRSTRRISRAAMRRATGPRSRCRRR